MKLRPEHPPFDQHSTACEMCDWVNVVPAVPPDYRVRCGRCRHVLYTHRKQVPLQLWLNCLAAIVMLVFSLAYPFLGFSADGVTQKITFFECISNLLVANYPLLALMVSLMLLVFPLLYLLVVVMLLVMVQVRFQLPRRLYRIVHLLDSMKPWLMVDVFLLGGLVALIKLQSLAEVELGYSFWAFCCFTLLMLRVVSLVEKRWFWQELVGQSPAVPVEKGTAQFHGLLGCRHCGAVVDGNATSCPRCHHVISSRRKDSVMVTLALLCAAVIMYIPANLYPIMTTTFLGQSEASTIIGGIIVLWAMHSYPVALVILVASIIVPLAKMLALLWLCWQVKFSSNVSVQRKQTIYHITEFVGKWSMVDVFVVAILAALVQLGNLMNIIPGTAALSFSFVVILTMLAAMSFDSRLLWDTEEQ